MSKSEIEFASTQAKKLAKLLSDAHSKSAEAACFEDATYAKQLRMEANHLIANGVTIPVYCKECVHRKERVCFNPYAGMWVGVELKDSDFCSYGERRTDG